MADLNIFEKYPDSWRMDHPDFSDVCKTTYSVGKITEIQKLQDDPIKVAPLVKVEVEGQESDFIPLFYQPKVAYWDDEEVLTTAFNEAEKYFEKAWMSFRGADEVVVMLRAPEGGGELKPFAALAFTDGVPRIGEDIIKIEMQDINDEAPRSLHLQASKETTYGNANEEKKGPDGLELGLKQDCERIIYEEEMDTSTRTWNFMNPPAWYQYAQWNADNIVKQFHWDKTDPTHWVCVCDALQFSEVWMQVMDLKAVVQEFLVPVGPILYLFQFLGYEREPSKYWGLLYIGCHHFKSGFGNCGNDMAIETYELCFQMPGADGRGDLLACPNVEQIIFLGYGTYDPINASKTIGYILAAKVKAAPYSKELFEKMQGVTSQISPLEAYHKRIYGQDWSNQYEEFTEQVQFSQYLSWLQKLQPNSSIFSTDLSSILLSVRPHTQDELKDAGMWPK